MLLKLKNAKKFIILYVRHSTIGNIFVQHSIWIIVKHKLCYVYSYQHIYPHILGKEVTEDIYKNIILASTLTNHVQQTNANNKVCYHLLTKCLNSVLFFSFSKQWKWSNAQLKVRFQIEFNLLAPIQPSIISHYLPNIAFHGWYFICTSYHKI